MQEIVRYIQQVEDPSTLLDLTNIKDSEPCELMMTDVTSCVPATGKGCRCLWSIC